MRLDSKEKTYIFLVVFGLLVLVGISSVFVKDKKPQDVYVNSKITESPITQPAGPIISEEKSSTLEKNKPANNKEKDSLISYFAEEEKILDGNFNSVKRYLLLDELAEKTKGKILEGRVEVKDVVSDTTVGAGETKGTTRIIRIFVLKFLLSEKIDKTKFTAGNIFAGRLWENKCKFTSSDNPIMDLKVGDEVIISGEFHRESLGIELGNCQLVKVISRGEK